ncbi:NAD(P)H-binding protein [Kitasatospora sp. NPDC096147]|uniref:NAD(P)H-binding protein n=1 Tax=Kitasatospora sp. NPDC096147 TaxID=3364093 RepID=UPI00381C7800
MSTVLVTGARGRVARAVTARLAATGHVVRAAGSVPTEITAPAGVETAELALDRPETFEAALRGVRQVFLYPEPAGITAFIRAAESAGVEHAVLLSSSTVTGPDAAADPLAGHSLRVEQALTAAGVPSTFLRPDAFASNALGWAPLAGRALAVPLAYPDAETAPIHPEDLADLALDALTGGPLAGRSVTLTGPESLSFRTQLAVLAEAGGHPIEIERVSRAEAEAQMSRYRPHTMVSALLDLWAAADGRPATVHDTTATLLGRPARTFHQWARENAAAFAPH